MSKTGIELIKQEREEQMFKHRIKIQQDVLLNRSYQLSDAAKMLCDPVLDVSNVMKPCNWDEKIWNKMISKSYKDRLIIAGALIAAEIDRLNAVGD